MLVQRSGAQRPNPSTDSCNDEVQAVDAWMHGRRFAGTQRLHSARQVVEQRGTIAKDHTVARVAADQFYARIRSLCNERRAITTFGPYSPGQAVAMKRMGIEAIYLGGWATSAKGSAAEDPGPDLASYPLSQVPNEAAGIVRALLSADRNQRYDRLHMPDGERAQAPLIDYSPWIIADADTGHGGDAHVRNLVRRFIEAGVPGYHIEDQKPGAKKCGHQAGKVLVSTDEMIKRLSAAWFQADVMGVAGIIVARTDAEAATLLDSCINERDQPFILGVTNRDVPPYRIAHLAVMRRLEAAGVPETGGHRLYASDERTADAADTWLAVTGLATAIDTLVRTQSGTGEEILDRCLERLSEVWQERAGLMTIGEAVARAISSRIDEGAAPTMSPSTWRAFAATASWQAVRLAAADLGIGVRWDPEGARTPDGYYQVRGGIDYAVAKSVAVAPYADVLWMETKTADLDDARRFADRVHAAFPGMMLAYNLSPSFNWDTTGMTDEEMRAFPEQLAKLGYVFNFITYGGHQIDGLAAEEFATELRDDGMLALARVQRRARLLDSPYGRPQALVGGPRADAALLATSGLTATTKAMGSGSTHVQHLMETEPPPRLIADWLREWAEHHDLPAPTVTLRPHPAGSDIVDLRANDEDGKQLAHIVFSTITDWRGKTILTVRDQATVPQLRRKRLMTLLHLFLLHRYRPASVHYLSPTGDNRIQCERMLARRVFASVRDEVPEIILAEVNAGRVAEFAAEDGMARADLLREPTNSEN